MTVIMQKKMHRHLVSLGLVLSLYPTTRINDAQCSTLRLCEISLHE